MSVMCGTISGRGITCNAYLFLLTRLGHRGVGTLTNRVQLRETLIVQAIVVGALDGRQRQTDHLLLLWR